MKKIFNENVRKWLYNVSVSLILLLGAYGIISEDMVPLIIQVVAAILAISMARLNIPKNEFTENDYFIDEDFGIDEDDLNTKEQNQDKKIDELGLNYEDFVDAGIEDDLNEGEEVILNNYSGVSNYAVNPFVKLKNEKIKEDEDFVDEVNFEKSTCFDCSGRDSEEDNSTGLSSDDNSENVITFNILKENFKNLSTENVNSLFNFLSDFDIKLKNNK